MFSPFHNAVVPFYKATPSAMKNWHYKRGGLSWGMRGGTIYLYLTISVQLKFCPIRGVAIGDWGGGGLIRGGLLSTSTHF